MIINVGQYVNAIAIYKQQDIRLVMNNSLCEHLWKNEYITLRKAIEKGYPTRNLIWYFRYSYSCDDREFFNQMKNILRNALVLYLESHSVTNSEEWIDYFDKKSGNLYIPDETIRSLAERNIWPALHGILSSSWQYFFSDFLGTFQTFPPTIREEAILQEFEGKEE